MEEADGDPGRATHSVNDTDTPDSASRSGVFPVSAGGAGLAKSCWPRNTNER